MKVLRTIGKAIGYLLLVFIVFSIYEWNASANEVQSLCSDSKLVHSIDEVIKRVESSSYLRYKDHHEKGKIYILIHSPANMGRHICLVEYVNNEVVNASYSFLD